jgi:DNA-directed RNA polymerase subunit RPC12/RpoP
MVQTVSNCAAPIYGKLTVCAFTICKELDITVNELLCGERVSEENYQNKVEENMSNMLSEKEENKKKALLTAIIGVISTISFIDLLLVVCIYTDVIALPFKIVLIITASVIFALGMIVVMEGERTIGYYRCNKCGEFFIPTFMAYVLAMNIITKRYLKCPHCGRKSWCKKVLSKED